MNILLAVLILINLSVIWSIVTSPIWHTDRQDVDAVKNMIASAALCSFLVIVISLDGLWIHMDDEQFLIVAMAMLYSVVIKQVVHIVSIRRIQRSDKNDATASRTTG